MITISGQFIAENKRAFTKKDGSTVEVREIAINQGGMDNVIVEVPVDYKLVKKEGNVTISNALTSAKRWNNESKRFEFVPVRYYVLGDKPE